jgi:hypothetical protein
MVYGSLLNDAGHLIYSTQEKFALLSGYPAAAKYFRKFLGSKEFIRGLERWVLYINDSEVKDAKEIPDIKRRLLQVKNHREESTESSTQRMAITPHRYYFSAYDNEPCIVVPRTSSERREYVPIGFVSSDVVASDSTLVIFSALPWVFGVVSSRMHMVWMRAVSGRMKTDYRYSVALCYNTFPLPEISQATQAELRTLAFRVMSIRESFPEKSLSELYDPELMPEPLKAAHSRLDARVEACYQAAKYTNDDERLATMFRMFERMTGVVRA